MSNQLQALTFRLACNQSSRESVYNRLSGVPLSIYAGNRAAFQCGVFRADPDKGAASCDLRSSKSTAASPPLLSEPMMRPTEFTVSMRPQNVPSRPRKISNPVR